MAKTLRDEFAMAALTGLVVGETGVHGDVRPDAHRHWVKGAYKIANAMMKERLKHSTAKERGVFSSD